MVNSVPVQNGKTCELSRYEESITMEREYNVYLNWGIMAYDTQLLANRFDGVCLDESSYNTWKHDTFIYNFIGRFCLTLIVLMGIYGIMCKMKTNVNTNR